MVSKSNTPPPVDPSDEAGEPEEKEDPNNPIVEVEKVTKAGFGGSKNTSEFVKGAVFSLDPAFSVLGLRSLGAKRLDTLQDKITKTISELERRRTLILTAKKKI
jgi:hypothetical protein